MEIRKCAIADCGQLARMNRQLIEDERHDNTMPVPELQARMEGFLESDYTAFFFVVGSDPVGYALVKHTCSPLYLRQFFICREQRRKGFGTEAFRLLLERLQARTIDIEVLCWNEAGLGFWESLGFRPRSIYMRYGEK